MEEVRQRAALCIEEARDVTSAVRCLLEAQPGQPLADSCQYRPPHRG